MIESRRLAYLVDVALKESGLKIELIPLPWSIWDRINSTNCRWSRAALVSCGNITSKVSEMRPPGGTAFGSGVVAIVETHASELKEIRRQ